MPINPSDIWPEDSGFPTLETIHRYVDGTMDREEQYRFERQMASSDLLSDAVEGLRVERAQHAAAIGEIHTQIDAKLEQKVKVIPLINYRNLAIAASFALLITAGGIFFLNWIKDKSTGASMAIQLEPVPDSISPFSVDSVTVIPPSTPIDQAIAFTESKDTEMSPAPKTAVEEKEQAPEMGVETAGSGIPSNSIEASPLQLPASSSQVLVEEKLFNTFKNNEMNDSIGYESLAMSMLAMETSRSVADDDILEKEQDRQERKADKKTMAAPSRPKPSPAKGKASTADAAGPSSPTSRFPESIVQLIKGDKIEMAIKQLDAIIALNDHRQEEALWLKAACLLKANKTTGAKEILEKLRVNKGSFQDRAQKVLEGLK